MSSASDYVLGKNVDNTFFYAISNTDDDPRNSTNSFINVPFGGLGFSKAVKWSVALTETSLPRTNSFNFSKQLWFKRYTLPERCDDYPANAGYTNMYRNMGTEGYLLGPDYAKILNTLPKIRPRPDLATAIIQGKDRNIFPVNYPKELENFLYTSYHEYACPQCYFTDTVKRTPDTTNPTCLSEGYFGISSSLDDDDDDDGATFDISIGRGGNGVQDTKRTNFPNAIGSGDAGYRQIIRLSRELATILNVEYWESDSYFPKCEYDPNDKQNIPPDEQWRKALLWMTVFANDDLYSSTTVANNASAYTIWLYYYILNNPKIVQPNAFIMCPDKEVVDSWKQYLTDRYFSLTILHKNYTADTPILGEQILKDKTFHMESYTKDRGYKSWTPANRKFEQFLQTDEYDGHYVDILICTNHPSKIHFSSVDFYKKAAADLYYKSKNIPKTPPCVKDQYRFNCIHTLGIPFALSESIRRPTLSTTHINFTSIKENIYSGDLEQTLAIISTDERKERIVSTFIKDHIQIRRPLRHELIINHDTSYQFTLQSHYNINTAVLTDHIKYASEDQKQKALSYYTKHPIIIYRGKYPVSLTLKFNIVR